jgi:hypothetical protein
LKFFKSNGYEYIYIYYKQNCLIRINTKYTVAKNSITKDNLYKSSVPDFKMINEHILLMKQRVNKYISDHLINKSEMNQREALNIALGISIIQVESQLLIPFFSRYIAKLNSEFNYQPKTLQYYNTLRERLEEIGKEVLRHKIYLADLIKRPH